MYTLDTMQRTNIYLRTSQIRRLKALERQTGAPVAELVRRAIDAFLESEAAKSGASQGEQKDATLKEGKFKRKEP